jgi:hypothetical protein
VNDQNPTVPPPEPESSLGEMRSPIRPAKPREEPSDPPPPDLSPAPDKDVVVESPNNPGSALNVLRGKMETIADEFAEGKINRAQFNAMYKRYSEQRTIIERLLQRDPETDAWRQVISTKGHTSFLRSHFEALPLYYAVHSHQRPVPIITGGSLSVNETSIRTVLQMIWQMGNRPKMGVGRKTLSNGEWLIVALGEYALTVATFSLEPSIVQARFVRDLHNDFERANNAALARNWIVPERMVFPQRALMESNL